VEFLVDDSSSSDDSDWNSILDNDKVEEILMVTVKNHADEANKKRRWRGSTIG
jgi:hypothetical protein